MALLGHYHGLQNIKSHDIESGNMKKTAVSVKGTITVNQSKIMTSSGHFDLFF